MKTKWKLIYSATEQKEEFTFEYNCYYEDVFCVLYRRLNTIKNARTFSSWSKTTGEYLEIVEDKFDATENSVKYWLENKDNYIVNSIEQFNDKH